MYITGHQLFNCDIDDFLCTYISKKVAYLTKQNNRLAIVMNLQVAACSHDMFPIHGVWITYAGSHHAPYYLRSTNVLSCSSILMFLYAASACLQVVKTVFFLAF